MSKKKTVEEIYQKTELHEHTLKRPDSYLGSIKNVTDSVWVIRESDCIFKKVCTYNPGLLKIFDEILVNAIDRSTVDSTCNMIKVDIENDTISIYNNGEGIPIVKHKQHNIYIPELVLGNLLTSSNYDDSQKRIIGGLNGLGAKLTNIYSSKFVIETCDGKSKYKQTFTDNMYNKTEPKITDATKKSYTKITFTPDLKIFKMSSLTDDNELVMKKRVYDAIACTNKNVKVYFNGVHLVPKTFLQYMNLYGNSPVIAHETVEETVDNVKFVWEYAVKYAESYTQVSFVNGITTTQGGTHVDYVVNQVIKNLLDQLTTKKKIQNIKPNYIKDKLFIFVKATVINPGFNSQSKEKLNTKEKDFGINFTVSDKFISKIYKSEIVNEIIEFTNFKNTIALDKGLTKKKQSTIKVPKLDDANNAGTKKSLQCSLILTEGDSAKQFAAAGMSIIGSDNYGIFPLRGKLLNVREATQKQLVDNEEINNLKKILGLHQTEVYTKETLSKLRYGSIIILVDADPDGSHIKCLLVNMFSHWWPELLEIEGFIRSMQTPIIRVTKGKKFEEFYTTQDYKAFMEGKSGGWKIKYYKGLGSSTDVDAKRHFGNLKSNLIGYTSEDPAETDKAIKLAFEKKQADNRKEWLLQYNSDMYLEPATQDVSYPDLINKELIHFSMYDVIRSIPCICDGLKVSQRKILYTMFKMKYSEEVKVAKLSGDVTSVSSYHHGESSLHSAIIHMAQDFVGSNNINILLPNGQFGTRKEPKGAAAERYIFTELNPVVKTIYKAVDIPVLPEQLDENEIIEPKYYVPIIPMILVNGTKGIGTGYSTDIPSYNPVDIIANMKRFLSKKKMVAMAPWYRGFKGTITPNGKGGFTVHGVYTIKDNKIVITEIPINKSIDAYKEFIEGLVENTTIDLKVVTSDKDPHFTITFTGKAELDKFIKVPDLYKKLGLTQNISTSNYHLLDQNSSIKKYGSAEQILAEFMKIRLDYNTKRKAYIISDCNTKLPILANKMRFLKAIMNNELIVYKKSKAEIDTLLTKDNYLKVENGYNYLTSMPIHSFTKEKLEELKKKCKDIQEDLDYISSVSESDILLEDLQELQELTQ